MSFRLFSSFLWQHLISQRVHLFFGPSRRHRHASYTLVYPAWFLLLYFYYCNMLFLLFSLQQLDQLLAEQSHLFSELGLSDWKKERKPRINKHFQMLLTLHILKVGAQKWCSKELLAKTPQQQAQSLPRSQGDPQHSFLPGQYLSWIQPSLPRRSFPPVKRK